MSFEFKKTEPVEHKNIFTLPTNEDALLQNTESLGRSYEVYHKLDSITHKAETILNLMGYFFLTSYVGSYVRYQLGVAQIAFGFLAAFYQLTVSTNRLEDAKKVFTGYVTNGLANIGRSYIEFLGGTMYLLIAYDHMPVGFSKNEVPLNDITDAGLPEMNVPNIDNENDGRLLRKFKSSIKPHLENIMDVVKEKFDDVKSSLAVFLPLPNGYGFRTPLPTEKFSGTALTPERYGMIASKAGSYIKEKITTQI